MKVAIIGAGVTGLSAARELRANGLQVKLFEKSRGVGGRLSTRYAGDWEFDHGAQYFTAQDEAFRAEINQAVDAGVVTPWESRAFYLTERGMIADTGRSRYVGSPRMNSLAKYWADGFDVDLERRVSRLDRKIDWNIEFEDGSVEDGFDAVISTLPPAQAEAILPLDFPHMEAIKRAEMQACFSLMVGLSAPINLDWDTLRVKNLPIDWIAVNHTKPRRNQAVGALVIHAEPSWSDKHVEADRDWIQNEMLGVASNLLRRPLNHVRHLALHRWLYASSKAPLQTPRFVANRLAVCGDWCLGGRVEGAWLSGRAAAEALL